MPSDASREMDRWILHFRRNPLLFVTKVLGASPETWQEQALNAFLSSPRMSIRSGHGVGKSTFLAWLIIHHHATQYPAKTGTTAPTEHQLRDILWTEVRKWLARAPESFQQQWQLTDLRMELKAAPAESFAAGKVAAPQKPEAFAGYHSENMLLIADEASGVSDENFEVGLGAMSTPNARMVLAGNPTRPNGFFHTTHTKLRARWWTQVVNSEDVPRARGHIDDIIATYGRDSNAYRIRVLGEFPTTADEQVIPLDLVEAAVKRTVEPSESFRVVWGVDVARFGDDRSALAKRRGNVMLAPVQTWRGLDTMQLAGRINADYEDTWADERPSEILVDVIGIGAGVVDRLGELGLPVRGINVGEAAAANDRYMRLRDELWFKGREWFAKRDCGLADDQALIAELTAPVYGFSSSGKIIVEPKDETKKRLGHSPDLADAFLLTLAGGLDRMRERTDGYSARPVRRGSWVTA